jgi:hypothetical protein
MVALGGRGGILIHDLGKAAGTYTNYHAASKS